MTQNRILNRMAWGVSLIFHPLLIPTYMLILLLLVNPYLFGVNSIGDAGGRLTVLLVFLYTFFVPSLAIVVMYYLGMVDSLALEDRQQRIGPYLITGVLYLWVYWNFRNNAQIPTAYTAFMLGTVISLFAAFFVNIFSKVSAHAVGMGGLVAMVIITMVLFSYNNFTVDLGFLGIYTFHIGTVLLFAVLAAGIVGSSRLLLTAHDALELYGGYLIGFTSQLLALRFLF